jgi:hypothetical protein
MAECEQFCSDLSHNHRRVDITEVCEIVEKWYEAVSKMQKA